MTKKAKSDATRPMFAVVPDRVKTIHGVQVNYLTIKEKYDHRDYAVERALFRTFTDALQNYLKKHPDIQFSSKRNIARTLTYLPTGVKTWAQYMPGAFATHPVHSPEVKTLANDQKIDFITRRLFRHSVDAVGLRNRAHILAWLAQQHAVTGRPVWLSIATGSGQHVYDALRSLENHEKYDLIMSDTDSAVLTFARKLYEAQDLRVNSIMFERIDALSDQLDSRLRRTRPTVVDVMGLFEYLGAQEAAHLLARLYAGLAHGGMIVFTNMSPDHPHLDLHQRGLGWPGVKPRTIKAVVDIISDAKIPLEQVTVFKSQDKVYGVYAIRKAAST